MKLRLALLPALCLALALPACSSSSGSDGPNPSPQEDAASAEDSSSPLADGQAPLDGSSQDQDASLDSSAAFDSSVDGTTPIPEAGADSDSSAPPTDGGPSPSAIEAWASAICHSWYAQCATFQLEYYFGNVDHCTERLTAQGNAVFAGSAPGYPISESQFVQCTQTLQTAGVRCEDLYAGAFAQNCNFRGLLAQDDDCSENAQCSTGYCSKLQGASCGHCQTRPQQPLGGVCSLNTDCTGSLTCFEGHCSYPGDVGQDCTSTTTSDGNVVQSCNGLMGLRCSSGTCLPAGIEFGTNGEEPSIAGRCLGDLWHNQDPMVNQCVPRLADGAPCPLETENMRNPCRFGSMCVGSGSAQGICTVQQPRACTSSHPDAGASDGATTADAACSIETAPLTLGPRSQCYSDQQCSGGRCAPTMPGGVCNGCSISGYCPGTTSCGAGGVGDACLRECDDSTDCPKGMKCLSSGLCTASCQSDSDCASPLTCRTLPGGSMKVCQRPLCPTGCECPVGWSCRETGHSEAPRVCVEPASF